MILKNLFGSMNNRTKRNAAKIMAGVLAAATILSVGFTKAYGDDTPAPVNLGVAEYFGIIAEESVVNSGAHCPSNVMTKNLVSTTIGYDRGGEDMLGNVYGQGIGVFYVSGKFDVNGTVFASKVYLNDNYSTYVRENNRYVTDDISGKEYSIGTSGQCRTVENISKAEINYSLDSVMSNVKALAERLSNREDNIDAENIGGGMYAVYVEPKAENVVTLRDAYVWDWSTGKGVQKSGATLCIGTKNGGNQPQNFGHKETQATLLVNIEPGEDAESFTLTQHGYSGYRAYDNTDGLVFNFGDYDGTVYLCQTAGTIIAPYADVIQYADHHGRIIAKNFTVGAEVHFIPSYDVVVEEETSETETETDTSSDETSSHEETTTERETTTAENEETTSEEETTLEIEVISNEKETTSTADDETTIPADETTTPADETTTEEEASEEETTTEESDIPEETTTDEQETTTSQETTSELPQETSSERNTTSIEGEETTTEDDTTSTPEQETTTEDEETTTPEIENDTTVKTEDDTVPEDETTDESESVTSEEVTSEESTKDTVSEETTEEEDTTTPAIEETLTENEEDTTTTGETEADDPDDDVTTVPEENDTTPEEDEEITDEIPLENRTTPAAEETGTTVDPGENTTTEEEFDIVDDDIPLGGYNPKTGDENMIHIYIIMAGLALGLAVTSVVADSKRKASKNR